MKIIKEGIIRKITKKFTCPKCDCVFEAEYGEYQTIFDRNEEYYVCICPMCNTRSYTNIPYSSVGLGGSI